MGGKSGLQTNTIPSKRLFLNGGGPKGSRKVPQKITAIEDMVRVKMGGKSTQFNTVMYWMGKPYREQSKIVCIGYSFRLNTRVCCIDKWSPIYRCTHQHGK